MTTTTWSTDTSVDPPIYRKGVFRFQGHGLVLAVAAFVWGSLFVRAVSPFPLHVAYDTLTGAGFLFAAIFAILLSAVEVIQWGRALLPARLGGRPFSVGIVEALCSTGLLLHCVV